jgi:hypothetical protein
LILSEIPGVQVVQTASPFEEADDDEFVRPFSEPLYVSEDPAPASTTATARRFKFEQYEVGTLSEASVHHVFIGRHLKDGYVFRNTVFAGSEVLL